MFLSKGYNKFTSYLNEGSNRTKKLKKNVVRVTFIRYSSYIIEFVKVPILLSYLDNEKYGVWLTIVSILMWTHQFDFGLGGGLGYKFAEALAKDDKTKGRQLVSTAYVSMSLLMLISFVILAIALAFLNWNNILNVQNISSGELLVTVEILLFVFLSQFVAELLVVILKADQKADIASIFKPIGSIASLLIILVMMMFSHNSLLLASISMALPYLIILIIGNIYYFTHNYSTYKPSIPFFEWSELRGLYSLGLKYFVGNLSSLIVFSASNILVAQILGPTEVTVYNTARQYFYLPITLINIFIFSFSAPITEAYVKRDYGWIKRTMNGIRKIAVLLSLSIIVMLLLSDIAFDIWTRGKVSVSFLLSIVFAIYAIMNMFVTPYTAFIAGVGKYQVRMYISFFKIVTFLPVAIWMMKLWGLAGLVVAVIIINTLINWVFAIIQYKLIISGRATGIWNK